MPTKERKYKKGTPEAREFLRQQGIKGGKANIEKHGVERMREIGRLGGKSKLAKHGREAFQEMGRWSKGGNDDAA